jgi:amino acid adenylation domain-containing protein
MRGNLDPNVRSGLEETSLGFAVDGARLRAWVAHERVPGAAVGNEGIALHLAGPLDEPALEDALDALVARHDSLRTGYRRQGSAVELHVDPVLRCPYRMVDHAGLEGEAAARARAEVLRAEGALRFDVSAPPLLRATLIREGLHAHVLVLVFHRLAADGASFLRVFLPQLAALYGSFGRGEGGALAPAPPALVPPPDHDADGAPDPSYWQRQLADAPLALALPADRPPPARPSGRGLLHERRLGPEVRRRVEEAAARLEVAAADVTLAAWAALLARTCDENDLVVGAPVGGPPPGGQQALGCFADRLPLRLRLDESTSFADLARQARDRRREAAAHALAFPPPALPTGGGREASRGPLEQAGFQHLPGSPRGLRLDGLEVEAWRVDTGAAALDLLLEVSEEPDGGYVLALVASADLFDAPRLPRMLGHYTCLLEAALREPGRPIWRLELLPEDERRHIERASLGPALPAAPAIGFHQLLARSAAAFGGRTAVRSDVRRLGYAELFAEAHALAHALSRRGLGPGQRALIGPGDDPCDTLVAMLAVMAAGAAYVPLDADAPPSRLAAVARDSGASVLVAGPGFDDGWRPSSLPLVRLDRRALAGLPSVAPAVELRPDAPAYLIYTSGSTGRPKGVVVSHANLVHQTRARLARYPQPPATLLGTYSFAFDSSLAGISWTLATGGELRLAADDARRHPARLRALIRREGISHIDMVPSLYAVLLADARPEELASLRVVVCGGEELPARLCEQHFRLASQARLYNEYGPTEATVFATVHEVPAGPAAARTPIGAPVADTGCWIVDGHGELRPLGHAGELVLSGPGIALGYHGLPEETARAFATQPSGGRGRCYRTGDQARLREDGTFEFIGRRDDQIQVRGHRVELGEVEAVLRQAPAVQDAAVVLREDVPGTPRLVGYLVLEERGFAGGEEGALAAVREHLLGRLPPYMVPGALVCLPSLRRTLHGKLDRSALPPVVLGRAPAGAPEATRDGMERRVARLCERLLGVPRVGPGDDFFALGGHSLLVARLVDAVERELGLELPMAEVFQNPTPAALAAVLKRRTRGQARSLEVIRAGRRGLPLFFVGSTAYARGLVAHLEDARAVYGLNIFGQHQQGRGPDGEMDLGAVAAAYAREIREAFPSGPYCIASYCDDAKVALELARRLEGEGRVVAALMMIDAVWYIEARRATASAPPGRLLRLLRKVRRFGAPFVAHRLRRRRRLAGHDLRLRVADVEAVARRLLGVAPPLVLEHRVFVKRYFAALAQYQVPEYHGPVQHYVAEEWTLDRGEPLADGGELVIIPGYHDEIIEGRSLPELGRHMALALAAADQRAEREASGRAGLGV